MSWGKCPDPAWSGACFHLVRPDVCPVPTSVWTRPAAMAQVGESIPMQKWNSPWGGQVRYIDVAAKHQMIAGGL